MLSLRGSCFCHIFSIKSQYHYLHRGIEYSDPPPYQGGVLFVFYKKFISFSNGLHYQGVDKRKSSLLCHSYHVAFSSHMHFIITFWALMRIRSPNMNENNLIRHGVISEAKPSHSSRIY